MRLVIGLVAIVLVAILLSSCETASQAKRDGYKVDPGLFRSYYQEQTGDTLP